MFPQTPSSSEFQSFLRDGAVLSADGQRFWIGFGGWERTASPPAQRLSFFAPDFFLTDSAPWWTPLFAMEVERATLLDALGETPVPTIRWEQPSRTKWDGAFAEVNRRFRETDLRKAVPALFERAHFAPDTATRAVWLRRLLESSQPVRVYGLWSGGEGILGATPETLFTRRGNRRVSTMALAGTRPRPDLPTIWNDPKEIHEHELVVSDLRTALSPLGLVQSGARRLLSLALLEHWQTPVELELAEPFDFSRLVEALHPTAALGVSPRSGGWRWLGDLPGAQDPWRGRFGAPFGAIAADGDAHCLVAIRNVQWRGESLILGAGCGLVEQSECSREWEELALKRLSVKRMLGL